ncbi:MAG: capsular biosynthesis protein [Holophagae bacterium]|nr:MAG: capsular biosynthesis protein [Holophagae bacterium]
MARRLLPIQPSLSFLLLSVLSVGSAAVAVGQVESSGQAPASAAQALFLEGFMLQKEGDTEQAIERYRAALALKPDHLAALYELGWSYWVLGQWQEVIELWERVLELDPEYVDAAIIRERLPEVRGNLDLIARSRALSPVAVATPTAGGTVRIALGGDTMLGSELTTSKLPRDGGAHLFDAYSEAMRSADLAVLNLEGVLLDDGDSDKCPDEAEGCWLYRTPVEYAGRLVEAGVDAVSLANNHANDFEAEGRTSTRATLDAAGIAWSGPVGSAPVLVRGGRRIGFIAFSTSVGQHDLRRLDDVRRRVAELAERADLVVVSAHGGAEGVDAQHTPDGTETYQGWDRGNLRAFARAAIDAGADLVFGHGPHVLRGLEVYHNRLIAYSLGNFATYGGFSYEGPKGLSALLLVDLHHDGRFAGGQLIAGRQVHPGGPLLDPDRRAIAVVRDLSATDFGDAAPIIDPDGSIRPR